MVVTETTYPVFSSITSRKSRQQLKCLNPGKKIGARLEKAIPDAPRMKRREAQAR
jgi:hypothetical protein